MFKIAKSKLPELLKAIAAQQELFLPVNNNGQVNFAAWFEGCNADIETLKTVKSPKDMFFPQSETLYTVKKEQHKLSVEPQTLADQNFVAFGMKACDIQGIKVLDKVFLAEPVDTFYRARREHGTIVALACHEPEESCFCKVFGVDCAEPDADVVMWNANDTLYWKAVTDKGTALTEALSGVLENADAADEKAVETEQENIRAIVEKLPYTNLSLEGWNGNVTEEKFNSPVWEKLYKPCLACGTCTFVCPTCQCYDIKDYDTGHGIQRYRCWDSCMYSDFTMMAHGNNRTSQMQRFRQRFMHKLVYFPANNDGMYSCVGCGRCVEKCPSSLNIVKVIKAFERRLQTMSDTCHCHDNYVKDVLIPQVGVITDIREETPDVKTFRVNAPGGGKLFEHMPGQCAMLCAPGVSEGMFSITSSPTNKEYQEFSIKKCGQLTDYLHSLEVGDEITVRGPYGNHFPVEDKLKGKNLLFIAGGIGLAPLRSVINYVLDNRSDYGTVDILYGSRSKDDLVQLKEIQDVWMKTEGVNVYLTIDREQEGWDGHVGFVPAYLKELGFDTNKTALLCGPPIMIKFCLASLIEMGFSKEQVYTTLELRMKCGIGKCGRCNIGSKYVCKDGPVFRCDEIDELPNEY